MIKRIVAYLKFYRLYIYPLLLVISLPLILVVNTLWNIKSFNRDANYLIRHNSIVISQSIKPFIIYYLNQPEALNNLLFQYKQNTEDIYSISIVKFVGGQITILASTIPHDSLNSTDTSLNKFSLATNEAFAGLVYEPSIQKRVWLVSIPLSNSDIEKLFLNLKMKTDNVDAIIKRTTNDSLILLSILIFLTIGLLVNHLIFYKKALRAQELSEIDKMKDEFISFASHELRTPVTALTGYLELLKDKIPDNLLPRVSEDMGILFDLTNDLNRLINDLLEVSRIEQNRLTLNKKQTDINTIISDTVTKLIPLAENKHLQIKMKLDNIPHVIYDHERLEQILVNLINNSIKYSLKGSITIISKNSGKYIEVSVKDEGIGIPSTEIGNLFEKFKRIKDKQAINEKGTGLGLWITKNIVESLGGKIYAESIYNTGSCFTFTIPIS